MMAKISIAKNSQGPSSCFIVQLTVSLHLIVDPLCLISDPFKIDGTCLAERGDI
jgi:hypothetical protein